MICTRCGYDKFYWMESRSLFRCSMCAKDISEKSLNKYRNGKLPDIYYKAAEVLFSGGYNARQISELLRIQYKTAWNITKKLDGGLPNEPTKVKERKFVNHYLNCDWCKVRFLDKKGDRVSDMKSGKTKHAFCCHDHAMKFRSKSRENDKCKRCSKTRKQLSKFKHLHVTGVTFSNGLCPKCAGLNQQYKGHENLFELHELTQQLRKETPHDHSKHSRPSQDAH